MADIFISYSHEDVDDISVLASALEQSGYTVWWDRELLPGDHFSKQIQDELDIARAVIVFWTVHSIASKWVYAEAQSADNQEKLITIRSDDIAHFQIPLPYNARNVAYIGEFQKIISAVAEVSGTLSASSTVSQNNMGAAYKAAVAERLLETQKPETSSSSAKNMLMLVSVLIVLGSIIGFVAGRKDSPNYSNANEAYVYLATQYTVTSNNPNNFQLVILAGSHQFSYQLKTNRLVKEAASAATISERKRGSELSHLAYMIAMAAAPGVIARSGKVYKTFSFLKHRKLLVYRVAPKNIFRKIPLLDALYVILQTPAELMSGVGVLGEVGYYIGYRDTKEYSSIPFQEALHDKKFWYSMARDVKYCLELRAAMKAMPPLPRNSSPMQVINTAAPMGINTGAHCREISRGRFD